MIKASRHIPAWARDPRDPKPPSVEVASVDELLNVEWIKSWRAHPQFFRYSVSRHGHGFVRAVPVLRTEAPSSIAGLAGLPFMTPIELLIVELDEGHEWWVLAYMEQSPLSRALPDWKPVYAK